MTKLTSRERELLTVVAEKRGGLLFVDDGAIGAHMARWIRKLEGAGYITKERKSGPFGAFGWWLYITDAGREALA